MKSTIRQIIDLWENDRLCFWILSFLGFAFFYCVGRIFDFSKQDAAAWVQAIGSIGGILFAFYWGMEQERRAMQRGAEEKCAAVADDLTGVLEIAKSINNKITVYARGMQPFEYWKQRKPINELRTALEQIPLHQHPFSAIAVRLLSLKKAIDDFVMSNDEFDEMNREVNIDQAEWDECRLHARTSADLSIMEYDFLEKAIYEAIDLIRMRAGI